MNAIETEKKYPMISIRVKREQFEYLRRECQAKKLTLADYVRAVLFPFDFPSTK